ncbi:MAG: hypothetical protein RL029_914, partial [Actinomycetota bacterium]
MKMIFIFRGRPTLSVSRAKIQLCAQAKSPLSDGTCDRCAPPTASRMETTMAQDRLETIVSLAKRRGFV